MNNHLHALIWHLITPGKYIIQCALILVASCIFISISISQQTPIVLNDTIKSCSNPIMTRAYDGTIHVFWLESDSANKYLIHRVRTVGNQNFNSQKVILLRNELRSLANLFNLVVREDTAYLFTMTSISNKRPDGYQTWNDSPLVLRLLLKQEIIDTLLIFQSMYSFHNPDQEAPGVGTTIPIQTKLELIKDTLFAWMHVAEGAHQFKLYMPYTVNTLQLMRVVVSDTSMKQQIYFHQTSTRQSDTVRKATYTLSNYLNGNFINLYCINVDNPVLQKRSPVWWRSISGDGNSISQMKTIPELWSQREDAPIRIIPLDNNGYILLWTQFDNLQLHSVRLKNDWSLIRQDSALAIYLENLNGDNPFLPAYYLPIYRRPDNITLLLWGMHYNLRIGLLDTAGYLINKPKRLREQYYIAYYPSVCSVNNATAFCWMERHDNRDFIMYQEMTDNMIVGVKEKEQDDIPTNLEICTFPNPVSRVSDRYVHFNLNLPASEIIQLKIYTSLGEEICTPIILELSAGKQTIQFDLLQKSFTPGIYFYRIITSKQTLLGKMIILH